MGVYAGVFLVALAMRLAYWAYAGTRVSPDGYTYLGTCNALWGDFWGTMQGFVGIEYVTFLVPFCSFVALPFTSLSQWVLVQILATSVASVLVADAAWRLWGPVSGVFAGGALAVLWETAQWDVYVLSESTFVFWLAFVFWAYARRRAVPGRRADLALWGGLFMLAFARPVGAPIVALMLASTFLPRWAGTAPRLVPSRTAAGVAIVAMFLAGAVVSDRSSWGSSVFEEVWLQGLIVHDDLAFQYPYALEPAGSLLGLFLANPVHVPVIAMLKGLVLYLPFVGRFSLIHNGMNLVTLVPVLLLGLYGLVAGIRRRDASVWVWLAPVVAVTLVSMATFVDYDWRYRVPVTLGLVMGVGYALSDATPVGQWLEAKLRTLVPRSLPEDPRPDGAPGT